MSERRRARKLGPVEIVAVVFVALLLMAVIIGGSGKSRVDSRRVECAKNLSQIGRAMLIYASDYDSVFPRSGGRNCMWDMRICDWRAPDRFMAFGMASSGDGGVGTISSCFYLLVKYAGVAPNFFVCPGEDGTAEFRLAQAGASDKTLADLWDFGPTPTLHCSYSYHMPFVRYPPLTIASNPDLALAADRNPWMDSSQAEKISLFMPVDGTEAAKVGNSPAHDKEGQNVLFMDGHVNFEDYAYCGINDDNIYTHWDGGDIRKGGIPRPWSEPEDRTDSILVNEAPTYRKEITREVEPIDTSDLKQTAVVGTLDCPMPEHKNVIWCSTFQMAWDKLKNDVIGEPVRVRDAEEIASRLNRGQFDQT